LRAHIDTEVPLAGSVDTLSTIGLESVEDRAKLQGSDKLATVLCPEQYANANWLHITSYSPTALADVAQRRVGL
jgi:hypothetical protein